MQDKYLKDCPFCGGDDIDVSYDGPNMQGIVACMCGAQTRAYEFNKLRAIAEAINKWNKRA